MTVLRSCGPAVRRQPNAKTVVAELKVTLSDVDRRSMLLKAASAARAAQGELFQVDRSVTDVDCLVIDKFETFLVISCHEPLDALVLDASGAGVYGFKINNLYLVSGSSHQPLRISAPTSTPVRLTAIWN